MKYMRNIKTYEIFNSKREYNISDYCPWDSDEILKLESIGFRAIASHIQLYYLPYYYNSPSENLNIKIEKILKTSISFKFGDRNWKYVITIVKDDNEIKKSFSKNKFDEMLNFVSINISDVDKMSNKYNI